MKKIAIILSMLCFAPAAFAGGMILYSSSSYPITAQPRDPNATFVAADPYANPQQETVVSSKTTREGRIRVGRQHNDPNSYWNFGAVNFGSGFSSEGSSTKRY